MLESERHWELPLEDAQGSKSAPSAHGSQVARVRRQAPISSLITAFPAFFLLVFVILLLACVLPACVVCLTVFLIYFGCLISPVLGSVCFA